MRAAGGPVSRWAVLVVVLGCGRSPDASVDAAARAQDAAGDPAAPIFLSFGTSAAAITEHESVTFAAVVTDPDGIDDVVGGTLLGADEQIVYGAFATAAAEGAYSLTLSWAELDAATPIEFDREAELSFTAVFFDQAGHRASRSATLRLHCDGDAACDGACTDVLGDSDHCGACRMQCAEPCEDGRCHGRAPCAAVTAPTSCDDVCAAVGSACMPDGCGPAALVYASEDECLAIAPVDYVAVDACAGELWTGTERWATCCCTP